jgi:hypothetical protein
MALEALGTPITLDSYHALSKRFEDVSTRNHERLPQDRQERFQQFFFRVRDDVDQLVADYYIDFHVLNRDGTTNEPLTVRFDEDFKTKVTLHSTTKSHRVFMMSCQKLGEFHAALRAADARLALEVTGVSPLPDVRYETHTFTAYDPGANLGPDEPLLLEPNTTTLVDVILNRLQTDKLATISPGRTIAAAPAGAPASPAAAPEDGLTGRAALIHGSGT